MLRSIKLLSRTARSIVHVQANRSMSVITSKLVYSEFGEPVDVIRRIDEQLPEIQQDDVLVKVLAAPINPADMNTIQGRYPVKPQFPAVGGKWGIRDESNPSLIVLFQATSALLRLYKSASRSPISQWATV